MYSLLSYGEVLVDFLPASINNPNYIPLAGGAPANVAVAFAKLGGESYFAGGISEDNFGNMLLQQLESEGVNTCFTQKIKNANTALVLVSLDEHGERDFNFYRHNTADTLYTKAHIDNIEWQGISVFHYCSNTLTSESMSDNTLYAIKQAKANNVLISFDVNLRQQLWNDLALLPKRVEACIRQSDIIKLSKDEAEYLANIQQLEAQDYIRSLISLGAKLIVITDGSNAVQATCKYFSTMHEVPKIIPIDTTGAGDSFISGFLFYLTQVTNSNKNKKTLFDVIEQPDHIYAAVLFAAKCGAFTCQKKGAFAALPKITDI